MNIPAQHLILPSFAADALCLGPHWIYNQDKIQRLYADGIRRFDDPKSEYHPGKKAGDFTHYGDQTLALLRSVVLRRGFEVIGWREDWTKFWNRNSISYRDGATKSSLDFISRGVDAASESNDLAGASRIAPVLAALKSGDLETRIDAARKQTALTHGDRATIDAAEFFTRVVDAITRGRSVPEALEEAAGASYSDLDAIGFLDTAKRLLELASVPAGAKAGLTCHTPEAFPLTLYFLLKFADEPLEALIRNAMTGGDSSARGMLIGLVMGAAHGTEWLPSAWIDDLQSGDEISALLQLLEPTAMTRSIPVKIHHPDGHELRGTLELPFGPPCAFALFAHCFTCGKSLKGATRISRGLVRRGIATLRFDFTGIGESEGDFSGTSFLSNVQDLQVAADWMRKNHQAPTLLIGHSLGGAAVLAAAGKIPESMGVATIAAPSDPSHMVKLLGDSVETIRQRGQATISLAGREFTIGSRFLDDLEGLGHDQTIANLNRDLLILHSPTDEIVSLEHAGQIFSAAKHPKSFHSLAGADHLLTGPDQSDYAAGIISAWARRFVCGGRRPVT